MLNKIKRAFREIPYSVSISPSLKLKKENKYRISRESPLIQVEFRSLDRISRLKIQPVKPWIEYQGPRRKSEDSHVSLSWTTSEGWYIVGTQTGRRTRPMPRLMGAFLCGTLVWFYPDILRIVLAHAEKTERFILAYLTLAGATLTLAGLIGFYMWLGFRSGPSGLEHALRQFSKVFGKTSEEEEMAKSKASGERSDNLEKNQVE